MTDHRIPEQDSDLLTIGHVCGPERAADLALLPMAPLRFSVRVSDVPVLSPYPKLAAKQKGICTRCLRRPVSTRPRKSPKPRRYCDRCTDQWAKKCVDGRGRWG